MRPSTSKADKIYNWLIKERVQVLRRRGMLTSCAECSEVSSMVSFTSVCSAVCVSGNSATTSSISSVQWTHKQAYKQTWMLRAPISHSDSIKFRISTHGVQGNQVHSINGGLLHPPPRDNRNYTNRRTDYVPRGLHYAPEGCRRPEFEASRGGIMQPEWT